jgi:hypothetical protein
MKIAASSILAALLAACGIHYYSKPGPLHAAASGPHPPPSCPALPDDELEMVRIALQDIPDALVDERTVGPGLMGQPKVLETSGASEEVQADWLRKSEARCIPFDFAAMPVLPYAAAEDDDPGGSWARFAAAHPGKRGLATVSRVGFSADRSEALLTLSLSCGSLCGNVKWVRMFRTGDRWFVRFGSRPTIWY